MSLAYDIYLDRHRENVRRAWAWMKARLQLEDPEHAVTFQVEEHDRSKVLADEYEAYDDYFYGTGYSYRQKERFDDAWLRHIHRNPHHWQHWVLIRDDGKIEPMEMPDCYVYEMIADWFSFSLGAGCPEEVLRWYAAHAKGMRLHEKTRQLVEETLKRMEDAMRAEKEEGHKNR